MARKIINTGSSPNDGTGDSLRTAAEKINENFSELYAADSSGGIGDAPVDSSGYVRLNSSWITLDSAGALTDAPSNGNTFARRDGSWLQIPNNLEAPLDSATYGRANGIWAAVAEEAPTDGSLYVRSSASWSILPNYIGDAPADGTAYVRQDSAWTQLSASQGIGEAPSNGQIYARSDSAWTDITSSLNVDVVEEAPSNGNYYLRRDDAWAILDSSSLTSAVGSIWETGSGIVSGIDSAATISLIDSDYVQARQIIGGGTVDSAGVISLIDSDYVQARQIIGGGGSGTVDSAGVIALVDSDYVQARQAAALVDSGDIIAIVDSDYVQARQILGGAGSGIDSDAVIALIDSDYVQAREGSGGGGITTVIQRFNYDSAIEYVDAVFPNPAGASNPNFTLQINNNTTDLIIEVDANEGFARDVYLSGPLFVKLPATSAKSDLDRIRIHVEYDETHNNAIDSADITDPTLPQITGSLFNSGIEGGAIFPFMDRRPTDDLRAELFVSVLFMTESGDYILGYQGIDSSGAFSDSDVLSAMAVGVGKYMGYGQYIEFTKLKNNWNESYAQKYASSVAFRTYLNNVQLRNSWDSDGAVLFGSAPNPFYPKE